MDGERRGWWWLFLAALVAHNVEEHLGMGAFLRAHRDAVPPLLGEVMGELSVAQFDVSLVVATALLAAVAVVGSRSRPHSVGMNVAMGVGVGAGLLLNALQHTVSSILLGALAPGAATAWLLLAPLGTAMTGVAFRRDWVTPKAFAGYTALGVLAMAALPALHSLSAMVLRPVT